MMIAATPNAHSGTAHRPLRQNAAGYVMFPTDVVKFFEAAKYRTFARAGDGHYRPMGDELTILSLTGLARMVIAVGAWIATKDLTPKFASLKAGTNDATVPELHFRYSVAKASRRSRIGLRSPSFASSTIRLARSIVSGSSRSILSTFSAPSNASISIFA